MNRQSCRLYAWMFWLSWMSWQARGCSSYSAVLGWVHLEDGGGGAGGNSGLGRGGLGRQP
ncbi:MAG: hypothetical protein VYA34_07475 [Myxococcota bacterium]|nr:hypothetical protein [Myxococcota bacterium]